MKFSGTNPIFIQIADYIKNNIASIPDNAISVMIRDIEEAAVRMFRFT